MSVLPRKAECPECGSGITATVVRLHFSVRHFGRRADAKVEIVGPVMCSSLLCDYTCEQGLEEFELDGITSLKGLQKAWGIPQKLIMVFGRDKDGNIYPNFEVYFDLDEYLDLDFIEEKLLGRQLFSKARKIVISAQDGEIDLEEVVGITSDGKEEILVRRQENEV